MGPWVENEGASLPGRDGQGGQAPGLRSGGLLAAGHRADRDAVGLRAGTEAWAQQRQPNSQLSPPCARSPLQLLHGQPIATSSLPVSSLVACSLVFLHSPLLCSLSLFMCVTLYVILCLSCCVFLPFSSPLCF